MPSDKQPGLPSAQRCTAPGCDGYARYTVRGTDDDGKPYTEHICGCALGYLCECDPTATVELIAPSGADIAALAAQGLMRRLRP